MSERDDLWSAIKTRERSRSWVRGATLAVGVGALATTGLVAYTLPNPPQHKAANTAVAPDSGSNRSAGDDGGSADDGSRSTQSQPSAPTQAPAPAHVTSGGS